MKNLHDNVSLKRTLFFVLSFVMCQAAFGQVMRVWLTHKSTTSDKIVINWQTAHPGNSVVLYGNSDAYEWKKQVDENVTMHHVEIELAKKNDVYYYAVQTGEQKSANASFKAYPDDTLRVAVVADMAGRADLAKVMDEDVHLLLSCGDHVAWKLSDYCPEPPAGKNGMECDEAFGNLIDAYPDMFKSTPFMPAMGNHDRQIRARDNAEKLPAYDKTAQAFRHFFELPGREWIWSFDIPDFSVRFLALDTGHLGDSANVVLDACHSVNPNAEQGVWYDSVMTASGDKDFIITLQNGHNSFLAGMKKWRDMLEMGTITISGSGYYAERLVADPIVYYNTAVAGPGNVPPLADDDIHLLQAVRSYIILTFNRHERTMVVELKELETGYTIDQRVFPAE